MIYILSGNDIKKKNIYVKGLLKNNLPIYISQEEISKENLFDYASRISLFNEAPIVIIENIIKNEIVLLKPEDLIILKESGAIFVFLEDTISATDLKKFKKYGIVEEFKISSIKPVGKMNVFNIAEAYSRRDKIGTWFSYREAVMRNVSPEEISGIIFWKIKTMILNGTRFFSKDELKNKSSELVSLYHRSHLGEVDFTIGLEQFILSSLNKN